MRAMGDEPRSAGFAPEQGGHSSDNSGRRLPFSLDDIPPAREYLKAVGAKAVNFRTADVRSEGNYPVVISRIVFSEAGEVTVVRGKARSPTPEEAEAIKQAFKAIQFPQSEPFLWTAKHPPINDPGVPWSMKDPANVFICWDQTGKYISFVQERVDLANGGKFYRPWSYYSDKVWRPMEPDGALPLYGLEQLKDHSIVCIHEGAKAALAVRSLLAGPALHEHPWGEDLKHMAHLGWLGGAERARDTDWAILRAAGVQRVFIICDNDTVGKNVVGPISRAVGVRMDALFFDESWPVGFDLADPFPARLFQEKMTRKYIGPSFTDCLHPATWATRQLPRQGQGAPLFEARREFIEDWLYIASLGVFVHRRRPRIFYTTEMFNNAVRHVSDVKDTAALLHKIPSIKVDGVCYCPELQSGVVNLDGERRFNTHQPTRVGKKRGNIWPFYRFMSYLIPDKRDRLNVLRWMATLIARPDVRMAYGLLLCSPTQGVGKSTLTDYILAMLIGAWNVSHPDVYRAVTSGFNSWLANTRLVVLAEMYVGYLGTKAYDTLKPLMTDKTVTVNEKFRPEYELENRAHFVGSSNDRVPMSIAGTDRRWLVPEVTEKKLPQHYWRQFYAWLADGGLEVIHQWAFDFVEKHGAVAPEDQAPSSSAKVELVDASLSDGRRLIRDLADHLVELGAGEEPIRVIVSIDAVKEWFESQTHLSMSERKMSQRAMLEVFEDAGLNVRRGDHRIFVQLKQGRRKMTAVANFTPAQGEEWTKLAREHLWSLSQLREAFDVM